MTWAEECATRIQALFEPCRDPAAAVRMRKYMRDLFPFLGVASPARRGLQREAMAGMGKPTEADLLDLAERLWALEEREYQYAALDTLTRYAKVLGPGSLPRVQALITTKSWWDTVDGLAADVIGSVVERHPETVATMDRWIGDENMWLARTALLHQLRYRERTDTQRLFDYCLRQAGHKDFFIRKAIGWALRQYAWTDPLAVKDFVEAHDAELSPLSKREALLAINGGRKNRPKGLEPA